MEYNLKTMYFEMQILIIWNNHEFGVLMNGNVKNVVNESRNSECMQVKCKYVVIVMWNILQELNFTSTMCAHT